MSWSDAQVAAFAKRFARSSKGEAWDMFVDDVREALIDSFTMGIVLAQEHTDIEIGEIRSLRERIGVRLERCGLPNPIAYLAQDEGQIPNPSKRRR